MKTFINNTKLSEDFKDYLRDFPTIPQPAKLTNKELKECESFSVSDLRIFFSTFGRSTWRNGLLQSCPPSDYRPILALIFKADAQFNHQDYMVFAYTAFGTMYLWHTEYGLIEVDLIKGEVTAKAMKEKVEKNVIVKIDNQYKIPFDQTIEDLNNVYNEDGEKIFDRCVEKLGPVGIGECFGFFPAIALGGVSNVENVRKVHAFEHFSFLAQLQPFYWVHTEVDFETGRMERTVVREIG